VTVLTQANFVAHDTFWCTGACTFTLPLSSTVTPNGQVNIIALGVTATLNTSGADVVAKNGALASATSTTVTQGATIATPGATGFYVAGT
jgi:hypothetical protein